MGADDLALWSRLWPLFVTAGLTLLVAYLVQFYIVPRVETRKRREDRWERDVLALGELLTLEYRKTASELGLELWLLAMFQNPPEDANPARVEELRREHKQKSRAAKEMFGDAFTRAQWLISRVESYDPLAAELWPFRRAQTFWHIASNDLDWLYYSADSLTEERVEKVRDIERAKTREFLDAIEKLASGRPPRSSIWRRARRWADANKPLRAAWRIRDSLRRT